MVILMVVVFLFFSNEMTLHPPQTRSIDNIMEKEHPSVRDLEHAINLENDSNDKTNPPLQMAPIAISK